MVKIAVAGGSGEVAREIIDALVAANKHDITILSRKDVAGQDGIQAVTWKKVDFDDTDDLAYALRDVQTVLSFIQPLSDPGCKAQKNLIDAAILAGVKRFAPSEWGSRGPVMPLWAAKDEVKEYLKSVNSSGKILEYSLFQPGLFLNYLATPHRTAEHLTPLNTFVDFNKRRAIVVDGYDSFMSFTTVQDLAGVVARAVDFEGEWPTIGGITGNRVKISDVIAIGERVRGGSFAVETVKLEDLEAGELKASWMLEARHHSVSEEQAATAFKGVLTTMLLSSAKGSWDGSTEWNQRFLDYTFTQTEEFLRKAWEGKP